MKEINERYIKVKRSLFDKVYSARLNPEQMKAVFTAEGPLLVLAGAGSGKTTVLVNRIVYLIKYGNAYFSEEVPEGVDLNTVKALEEISSFERDEIEPFLDRFASDACPPWAILAITFTNKAAGEIKERLSLALGEGKGTAEIWAGTFHSVCLRVLRKYADRVGLREGFSIYDTDDKKRMLQMCMKELSIDEKRLSVKVVASEISHAKDSLVSPDEYEATADPRARDIAAIYSLYQRKMREYNAVDFDDIIMKTVELFEKDEEALGYYQRKFRYILVDEYQDTNHAQFVLTKLIAEKRRNIMVVGDDDQSIYRFRGATVENILDFDKTYPEATVVKLEQNYRSTENILSAANAIIKNNEKRHSKKLWCDKGEGAKIVIHEANEAIDEAKYIIEKITSTVKAEGRKYSDFAILYRTNALGRSLQTSFTKSAVPFRVLGDMGFYERKEVKDMIAYLTVIGYTGDNLRLKRIINEPKRKIGPACTEAIEALAGEYGISMYEVVKRAEEFPILSKNTDKLKAFSDMIESVRAECELPSEMIKRVFERSGYHEMLKGEGFEGEGRIEMVGEFISAAVEYEKRCSEAEIEPTLTEFLEEIALISDVDKYDENADAVVLMTVHSAKGLEFPIVFIAGMEDGIFPSEMCRNDHDEMCEERRLAYVAITRAKEKLFITSARSRMTYGKTCYNLPSVFIREELPSALTVRDMPKRQSTDRGFYQTGGQYRQGGGAYSARGVSGEFSRPVSISQNRSPAARQQGAKGAEKYGIERFAVGTRVTHSIFGVGTIISAKDMGADILYEVKFDDGNVKKLMATFAKMKRA